MIGRISAINGDTLLKVVFLSFPHENIDPSNHIYDEQLQYWLFSFYVKQYLMKENTLFIVKDLTII